MTILGPEGEEIDNLKVYETAEGWPTAAQWAELKAADRLWEDRLGELLPTGSRLRLAIRLPMPGVARLRLIPANRVNAA